MVSTATYIIWPLLLEISDRRIRNGLRLLQRRFQLDIWENFFMENVVMHWNMLPRKDEPLKGTKPEYKVKYGSLMKGLNTFAVYSLNTHLVVKFA